MANFYLMVYTSEYHISKYRCKVKSVIVCKIMTLFATIAIDAVLIMYYVMIKTPNDMPSDLKYTAKSQT